jgi:hypothetical protein
LIELGDNKIIPSETPPAKILAESALVAEVSGRQLPLPKSARAVGAGSAQLLVG